MGFDNFRKQVLKQIHAAKKTGLQGMPKQPSKPGYMTSPQQVKSSPSKGCCGRKPQT